MVELHNQNLLYSILLFDIHDTLIFGMNKNEIESNVGQFDIEYVGQKFIIRSALYKFL